MNKQGDLSLNVIVMAVIALLILIVLTYITLNGTGKFAEGANACNVGERCVEDKQECELGLVYDVARPSSCKLQSGNTKGKYCCARI